jgi:hypothetical protein
MFFDTERRNAERIQKYNLGLTDDDELPVYYPEEHPFPAAMYAITGESIQVADEAEKRARLREGWYASFAEMRAAQEAIEEAEAAGGAPPPEEEAAKPVRSHKRKGA